MKTCSVDASQLISETVINGVQYSIREVLPSEIDQIVIIEQASATSPWTEIQFKDELTNPFSKVYVVISTFKVVAFVVAWHAADELQIGNIAVNPEFRRIGVATFLLNTIFANARELGCFSVHLEVRSSNTSAARFYEKLGFKQSGVRKNYYSSPREDAFVMSIVLS